MGPTSIVFLARGLELVLARDAFGALRVPAASEVLPFADGVHFLGMLGDTDTWAAPLAEGAALPSGLELVSARALFDLVDMSLFQVGGRAIAIAEWDRSHRYCGRCAHPTELSKTERVRTCPRCRVPFYPRVPPAVIVLIERPGEVLLARNASFPRPWFSTLAGFVEPGESLEETVAREVREEVGLEVKDLRYFGSQPWPFGRSLMVGFNATYAGGEIVVDPKEIAEARWFTKDALPQVPPKPSIARALIDDWLDRQKA